MTKSTEQLKTQLLSELKTFCSDTLMQEWVGFALSQMETATQEIKKGETKRIWYQKGIQDGKNAVREEIEHALNSYPPRPSEWDYWTTDIQNGYCQGEVNYRKHILESLKEKP